MAYFRDAVGAIKRVNDNLAVKLVPLALAAMGVVQLGVPLVIAALPTGYSAAGSTPLPR